MIHEHHATRLHWDLRLERDGALASWAIPKGLPQAPGENHLAVAVEDHPLEYLDFEAEIPKGQYGAGLVTIWDHGTYDCLKWEPRKVEVALHGERAERALRAVPDRQGRAAQELADPSHGSARATPSAKPMPSKIVPMLARAGSLPAHDSDWAFEIKWDGVRAIAYSEPGELRLESRNLNDITDTYPELFGVNAALGSQQRGPRRRDRRVRRHCSPQLRGAAAAHAHGVARAGAAAGEGHAGDLHDLRPAVARRPLADARALQRAPRAAGRAGA